MPKIRLYSADELGSIEWPESETAAHARSFLVPLMKDGIGHYIDNVRTTLYLLRLDDHILPITVNEKEYSNSYVASNYYGIHALREKLDRQNLLKRTLQMPMVWAGSGFLRWFQVNRVVFVNNWLLTNNLLPPLTDGQVRRMVTYLEQAFPSHFLMLRNIQTVQGTGLLDALREEKFHLFGSRHIYIYDPALKETLSSKVHYHHRRDFKLLEKEGYTLLRKEDLKESDIPRILTLYSQIYREGFTDFAPHYTPAYLKHALKEPLFDFVAIAKEGRVDGIFGLYTIDGMVSAPFFGYDNTLPISGPLYRLLSVLIIKEAESRHLILNDGSGGERSKSYRGLKPHPEYFAIYDRHLPPHRRLFWKCVTTGMNLFGPVREKKRFAKSLQNL